MEKAKKFKTISYIKFQISMGILIGLVLGIIYSFGGLIIDLLVSAELITSQETPGLSYGTVLAFGALLGMPLIFGFFGFILGVVQTSLYKIFAKYLSRIDINFEKKN